MNTTATRQTLYALLSALEEDLRYIFTDNYSGSPDLPAILGEELYSRAFDRYQRNFGESSYVSSLSEILPFVDFADAYHLFSSNREDIPKDLGDAIRNLSKYFEKLVPIRNRVMHSRPLDIDDLSNTLDVTSMLMQSLNVEFSELLLVEKKLQENPGYVLNLKLPKPPDDVSQHNLPVPDFDETGFVGRRAAIESLKKLIAGPYPVITIVGEGGLGKTALALKLAYDILDSDDMNFDCIVWASAKNATITAGEIKRIKGAVSDSLGMFSEIGKQLAGSEEPDPIAEIIEYLSNFRILLILDNLETIVDKKLYSFFEELPIGSKVLTTSRIGLGEFERRLKLGPMDARESSQLLRSLGKMRGIEIIAKAPQQKLNAYCHKMKNNPGFIKWFVSVVQSGQRPEDALLNQDLFLEFCMSNVYEYLETDSIRALKCLQTIERPLSLPEITYISGIETFKLQKALLQLLSTNMVAMSSPNSCVESESQYSVTDLARSYLQAKHPVKDVEFRGYVAKDKELRTSERDADQSEFSAYCITTRNRSHFIVAKFLQDALHASKRCKDEALKLVAQAKQLSPTFFEVHRVEAWIYAEHKDISLGDAAYKAAIELEPENGRLRYWYGGFLMRHHQDYDQSLIELRKAVALQPEFHPAKIEIARCLTQCRKYEDARAQLDSIPIKTVNRIPWLMRKYYAMKLDISSADCYSRFSNRDNLGVLESGEKMLDDLDGFPRSALDSKVGKPLSKVLVKCRNAKEKLVEPSHLEKARSLIERLETEIKYLGYDLPLNEHGQLKGNVTSTSPRGFGFLVGEDSERYWFHFSEVRNLPHSASPSEGDTLFFDIGHNDQGKCAVNCYLKTSQAAPSL